MITTRPAGIKGLGVFASRLIPRGTRIISERPLLTIHPGGDRSKNLSSLYEAVKRLDAREREELMSLTSFQTREQAWIRWSLVLLHTAQNGISSLLSKGKGEGKGKGKGEKTRELQNERDSIADHVKVLDIFRSNAFNTGGENGVSLFLKTARMNHSCVPNAQGNFHEGMGRFNVHATRDIEGGEEVCLNYIEEEGAVREVRVERLRGGYGFDCLCPACDLSGVKGREGEARRRALREVVRGFAERVGTGEREDVEAEMSAILGFIELYEGEGIAGRELTGMYLKAVSLCIDLQSPVAESLRYAALAVQTDKDCCGEDHAEYKKSLKILTELKNLHQQKESFT